MLDISSTGAVDAVAGAIKQRDDTKVTEHERDEVSDSETFQPHREAEMENVDFLMSPMGGSLTLHQWHALSWVSKFTETLDTTPKKEAI